MSLLGNILWIFLGVCLTIIGIPFGIQTIKLGILSLAPFGKEVRVTSRSGGCLYLLFNVLWLLSGGICVALTHVLFAFLCAITIIGIPFATQHMKLVSLALSPFGNYCQPFILRPRLSTFFLKLFSSFCRDLLKSDQVSSD